MLEVTYKWPNDVLVHGRKAAGILLESRGSAGELEWLVIGLGVNVASFPQDTRLPATSLHFEGCPPEVSEVDLLEAFARHMLAWINRWLDNGFAPEIGRHTSDLQSLMRISYAVFCLNNKTTISMYQYTSN